MPNSLKCPNCKASVPNVADGCKACGFRFSTSDELPIPPVLGLTSEVLAQSQRDVATQLILNPPRPTNIQTEPPGHMGQTVRGILASVPRAQTSEESHWQSNYVRLTNGSKFYLMNPSKTKGVRLVDLLVPIAEMSRYNFHLPMHYSVAEHCYYCSYRCSQPLYGLLHDLAEAIIGDLPSPIKVLCPDYKKVELRVEKWIYNVFGLDPHKIPGDLKTVDKRILTTEQLFFGRKADSIDTYPTYMDLKIGCWKSTYAVLKYFERLQELTNGKFTLDTILDMPEQPDGYFETQTGTVVNVEPNS